MPKNYERRERKLAKRRNGMKVNSRGLITVIQPLIIKKGKEAQREDPAQGDVLSAVRGVRRLR